MSGSLDNKAAADTLWELNKELLRRLYLLENKTLSEVKVIMAESHQFEAT